MSGMVNFQRFQHTIQDETPLTPCPTITIGDFVLPGPFYVNQVSQNGSLISGGDPVYTPNLVSGALPDGVSLGIQQAGDDYYLTASGVPLEFGDFPITVNVTDGNGCVSTNKALVISVWAVFSSTFGDILPGTNDFTIAVSGMVNPVGADKIASGLLNVTCSNVDDLDIYLDNPGVPPGTGTLVLTGSSSGLSGVDFTNTNFLQGSATSLASGTAPYTGDFNPGWYNGDAGFNLFVGVNPNGDWSLQVNNLSGNTYSLVSFTLTFKP